MAAAEAIPAAAVEVAAGIRLEGVAVATRPAVAGTRVPVVVAEVAAGIRLVAVASDRVARVAALLPQVAGAVVSLSAGVVAQAESPAQVQDLALALEAAGPIRELLEAVRRQPG